MWRYDSNIAPHPPPKILQSKAIAWDWASYDWRELCTFYTKVHSSCIEVKNKKKTFWDQHLTICIAYPCYINAGFSCRCLNFSLTYDLFCVPAIDAGVNEIVTALKNNNMYSNTYIVFTSDNGGLNGAGSSTYPLTGAKGSWFEGGKLFMNSNLCTLFTAMRRNLSYLCLSWLPSNGVSWTCHEISVFLSLPGLKLLFCHQVRNIGFVHGPLMGVANGCESN